MDSTKRIIRFTIFSFIITLSSSTSVVDFCVSDLSKPVTPAGYPCKNRANVKTDDFVFTGFRVPGNTSKNIFNYAAIAAFDTTCPGLNGQGLSMLRLDIAIGGSVPIHSHRVSEVLVVMRGKIIAGFIDTKNTAYYKTLRKGDMMVFPQCMLHFQVNAGNKSAIAFVTLNSPNPGFQFTTNSLSSNDLPTEILRRITLLETNQIKKLKNTFGGTN